MGSGWSWCVYSLYRTPNSLAPWGDYFTANQVHDRDGLSIIWNTRACSDILIALKIILALVLIKFGTKRISFLFSYGSQAILVVLFHENITETNCLWHRGLSQRIQTQLIDNEQRMLTVIDNCMSLLKQRRVMPKVLFRWRHHGASQAN
jgi:hypothetical protein